MSFKTLIAIAVMVLAPLSAQSATVKTLSLTIANGALAGNAVTGSVEYDESMLDANGDGLLYTATGFTALDLVFEGQSFDKTTDVTYPSFPQLSVDAFAITALNIWVYEDSFPNTTPITSPIVRGFEIFGVTDDGSTLTGAVTVVYYPTATVPLPAGLPLLASALAIGGIASRRRNRAA